MTNQTSTIDTPGLDSSAILDVAIVGAGASGCYTAYRLVTAETGTEQIAALLARSGRPRLDIRIFELSARIGGRLWTYPVPGTEGEKVELGGMGFSLLHQYVWGVCRHLGLQIAPFMPYMLPQIQYLRGHRFMNDQYAGSHDGGADSTMIPPYFLDDPEERGKQPWELIMLAFQRGLVPSSPDETSVHDSMLAIVGTISKLPSQPTQSDLEPVFEMIEQFTRTLRDCTYDCGEGATPIHEIGFWNFLQDQLGLEAYNLATDSSFAGSFNLNWNLYDSVLNFATTLFCMVLPDTDNEYAQFVHLTDGFQALPLELARRFEELAGSVVTRTRLESIDTVEKNGERLFRLEFSPVEGNGEYDGSLLRALKRDVVHARSVVLAMPRRSIEGIQLKVGIRSHPDYFDFSNAVASVSPIAAGKLFMLFDSAWWSSLTPPLKQGYSNTDLPLRAIYYIDENVQEDRKHARLLTSLSDGAHTWYWDGYVAGLPKDPAALAAERACLIPDSKLVATPRMVRDARAQLSLVHGCEIPEPAFALYRHWNHDPFGGGWHNWQPHVQSWVVEDQMIRPFDGLDLFICGEAYSSRQGWVEGALRTAEAVLHRGFGLPRPAWANPAYHPIVSDDLPVTSGGGSAE